MPKRTNRISLPSRIYSYGAKAPEAGLELVEAQMRLAHKYRNALVELELNRRKRVDEALRRLSPELVSCEEAIATEEQTLESVRVDINKARSEARKKVNLPDLTQGAREAKEKLKLTRAKRKELRSALFGSEPWKVEDEAINEWSKSEQKRLRSESGLYWGTYLHVETSMMGVRKGPPPAFKRWDGNGHLAVQIQHGISSEEAFGTDARIRIEPLPTTGSKAAQRRTKIHFRVGSDERGGPVFATIPVVLHRPLPDDAQIKWVHLIRRRLATHHEWSINFVVSKPSWPKLDQAESGSVGIDVGWRMKPDGSLRVAYWVGSDGIEGELSLPADWLDRMGKTRAIQSVRDQNFDSAHSALVSWLKTATIPAWMSEKTHTIRQWESQARLAALVIQWRTNRFAGDEEMFVVLEAWRKRDRHLYEYQENLRDKLIGRRTDLYRVFAAKMRRTYATAMMESLDLRDFHVLPNPEEKPEEAAVREHTRDSCLSSLFQFVSESMRKTIKVPAENTTKLCPKCGHLGEFPREPLIRTCPLCGDKDDQDRVAAINILKAASAEVVKA